ncbi:MAG TPA: hypothetical protein VGE83_11430, partial [Terracidiphilus sp.]
TLWPWGRIRLGPSGLIRACFPGKDFRHDNAKRFLDPVKLPCSAFSANLLMGKGSIPTRRLSFSRSPE